MSERVIHYGDYDGFSVVYTWKDDISVKVKVYEILGAYEDKTRLYGIKGGISSNDNTTEFDNAEISAEGYINWDGHGNWEFADLHLCGRDSFEQWSRLWMNIWDDSREILQRNDNGDKHE